MLCCRYQPHGCAPDELKMRVARPELVMRRNTLRRGGWSGGRRSAARERTVTKRLPAGEWMEQLAVRSVRARVETNGQPRMFVINQFVELDQGERWAWSANWFGRMTAAFAILKSPEYSKCFDLVFFIHQFLHPTQSAKRNWLVDKTGQWHQFKVGTKN